MKVEQTLIDFLMVLHTFRQGAGGKGRASDEEGM